MKPRTRRAPQSKLKGEKLAVFADLEARLAERPNPSHAVGQLRLLDVGVGDFALQIPEVVLHLLDEAEPIAVAAATERAKGAGLSWQDMKATLELAVRLVRARAAWEAGDTERANAELKQVSASAASRRNELIVEAATRTGANGEPRADWNAGFALALLRAAARSLVNSMPAALSLVDALIGTGEMQAASLILGQLVAVAKDTPGLSAEALLERIGRLDGAFKAPLERALNPREALVDDRRE